jgi:hypothetical protein
MEEWYNATIILNRSYMKGSNQLCTPAVLSVGQEKPVYSQQKAGWDPEPVWTLEEEKNFLSFPGNEPPFHLCPSRSLMTTDRALQAL